MKTINFNVYNLNELSDKAKEYAYSKWIENYPYDWCREAEHTLEAFLKKFDFVRIHSWECDSDTYRYSLSIEEGWNREIEYMTGARLYGFIQEYLEEYKTYKQYKNPKGVTKRTSHICWQYEDHCPLTGYFMDIDIMMPLLEYMRCPRKGETLRSLMESCIESWLYSYSQDIAYCTSYEYFLENYTDSNGYYEEDGTYYGYIKEAN